jgi:hypothetical protein
MSIGQKSGKMMRSSMGAMSEGDTSSSSSSDDEPVVSQKEAQHLVAEHFEGMGRGIKALNRHAAAYIRSNKKMTEEDLECLLEDLYDDFNSFYASVASRLKKGAKPRCKR